MNSPGNETLKKTDDIYDMIVFSHLRWQFVYQRPQHIISRMAKKYKILFVEEPLGAIAGQEQLANTVRVSKNLTVIQPYVNSIQEIEKVILPFVQNRKMQTGWFYSASFAPMLNCFNFGKIIYDCMAEQHLLKDAPKELAVLEKKLLAKTDVVFTAGKLLFEEKQKVHHNVHCFPSSVDLDHFKKATNGIIAPSDVTILKKPIVGYIGMIDKRIDLNLLKETASKCPDASFVMVGPLAKIEESDLPQAHNIFYMGMKPYEQLPNYLKGFDIAMMPYALNDAARFSSVKTLEYMAADKPIVSTAINDVARDHKDCVHIVNTAAQFSETIQKIEKDKKNGARNNYQRILTATSWDRTVEQMQQLMKENA